MRLRIFLHIWQWARARAMSELMEEFPGEHMNAGFEFDLVFQQRAETRMLNARSRLRDDFRIHDAADGLL